jgi:hypothetical protein
MKLIDTLIRYLRLIPEAHRISKIIRPRPPAEHDDWYLRFPLGNPVLDRSSLTDYMRPANAATMRRLSTLSPQDTTVSGAIESRAYGFSSLSETDEARQLRKKQLKRAGQLSFMPTHLLLRELVRIKFRQLTRRRP